MATSRGFSHRLDIISPLSHWEQICYSEVKPAGLEKQLIVIIFINPFHSYDQIQIWISYKQLYYNSIDWEFFFYFDRKYIYFLI